MLVSHLQPKYYTTFNVETYKCFIVQCILTAIKVLIQQIITKKEIFYISTKGNWVMKQIKWIFLIFAILSAASIAGIGIAVAEESLIGVGCCVLSLIVIMGLGFKRKRKMRESGEL